MNVKIEPEQEKTIWNSGKENSTEGTLYLGKGVPVVDHEG